MHVSCFGYCFGFDDNDAFHEDIYSVGLFYRSATVSDRQFQFSFIVNSQQVQFNTEARTIGALQTARTEFCMNAHRGADDLPSQVIWFHAPQSVMHVTVASPPRASA